jgi:hypothetical protein
MREKVGFILLVFGGSFIFMRRVILLAISGILRDNGYGQMVICLRFASAAISLGLYAC